MGPIGAAVRRLEQRSVAARAVFECIQGQIEASEENFMYHMRRFQDLEINRVFGRCPQPWACKEYRTCRIVGCKKEYLDRETSVHRALEKAEK